MHLPRGKSGQHHVLCDLGTSADVTGVLSYAAGRGGGIHTLRLGRKVEIMASAAATKEQL